MAGSSLYEKDLFLYLFFYFGLLRERVAYKILKLRTKALYLRLSISTSQREMKENCLKIGADITIFTF